MEKPIKIGLLGAGTVGSGVLQVLQENAREVILKVGAPVEIKSVLVRDAKKARPYMDGLIVTDKIEDILEDAEIKIVVELMGGLHPAREYMLAAMEVGKHVVTANKDVIAHFSFGAWLWVAPCILVAYILIVIMIRKIDHDDSIYIRGIKSQIYPNFIILFFLMLGVGAIPQSTDVYHRKHQRMCHSGVQTRRH